MLPGTWIKRHPAAFTALLVTVVGGLFVLAVEKTYDKIDAEPAPTTSSTPSSTTTTTTTTTEPPRPVLAQKTGVELDPVDGLDLDTGDEGDQNTAGMDLSPSANGAQLNAMTHGKPRFAPVTEATHAQCVAPKEWVQELPGIDAMRVGQHICVKTDRGNYGVITLRKIPAAGTPRVDLDFITWAR